MDRGILHRRLNARLCLLDSMQNLRLSDFWTENDPGDLRLFQRKVGFPHAIGQSAIIYKDGWRLDKGRGLPMIVPILKVFARRNIDKWNIRQVFNVFDSFLPFVSTSQVWTFALLVWQIYTHCQFGNRI